MMKSRKPFTVVYAILAVIFVACYGLIPFEKPAGSWLMFVFSMIAVAASWSISLYTLGTERTLMSKFYAYPVFKIGIIYMLAQMGLSVVIFIIGAFSDVPYWVGLLISMIIAGAAGIGMISADYVQDLIEQMDAHTELVTEKHRYFCTDIGDMLDLCTDENLRPILQQLATKFKYSDPISIPQTREKEKQIEEKLCQLRLQMTEHSTLEAEKSIREIHLLLSSRNRIKNAK